MIKYSWLKVKNILSPIIDKGNWKVNGAIHRTLQDIIETFHIVIINPLKLKMLWSNKTDLKYMHAIKIQATKTNQSDTTEYHTINRCQRSKNQNYHMKLNITFNKASQTNSNDLQMRWSHGFSVSWSSVFTGPLH